MSRAKHKLVIPQTSILYVNKVLIASFLNSQGTIDAFKRLLNLTESEQFVQEYGDLFLIPIKLNQDFVESLFSYERQMCGDTQNMTAYVYSYNINGYSCVQTAKALGNKQTNVCELKRQWHILMATILFPKGKMKTVYTIWLNGLFKHRQQGIPI